MLRSLFVIAPLVCVACSASTFNDCTIQTTILANFYEFRSVEPEFFGPLHAMTIIMGVAGTTTLAIAFIVPAAILAQV
jgi:hypothetical protein